ncbi:hypothetical protein ACOPJQ_13455 [Luteimonas dalianensis]|uniref:hypothetical protein n=1 Tax=Luteimonas dalianensis TaxID=1148196 RepID=UPI003BF0A952
MPALSPNGQPASARNWFASEAGQALLRSEFPLIQRALRDRPAPPWAWFAPCKVEAEDCGRGACLVAGEGGWEGSLRCGLPLPFATGSLATVVLQHAPAVAGPLDALLDECARVLIDGGRLYLLALNPLSPYRMRWRGSGLAASEPLVWRRRLRRVGLEPDPVSQGVGPVWKPRAREELRSGPGLAAAYVLGAEKRVVPLTPAAGKARRIRLQHGLSAG